MVEVCAFLILGLGLGWMVNGRLRWVRAAEVLLTVSIYAMLFLLGAGIGSNAELLRNIRSMGLQAAGITAFSLAGSIAAGMLCSRLISRK